MERKTFIKTFSAGAASLYVAGAAIGQTNRPPQLDKQMIQEFVSAGHNNLAKVKEMYAAQPELIYAAHDLGGGDFETALEGAGHVGNKEIALYLIDKGARTNLFVLTMLGKTKIVKPYLESFPSYVFARGPHGLTLLHHAQRGGEEARELLEYLQGKGLKETKTKL